MVIISLPRSRYTKLPSGFSRSFSNGIHYEMLFFSDTNLALESKFHRLMSYLHRFLFNSEAYIIDLIIGFYLTKVRGTSVPTAGKFWIKIHYFIVLFIGYERDRFVSIVSSLIIDFHYRYSQSDHPVFIGELHLKINSLMLLLPRFLSLASPRHFRSRLRFAKLSAAVRYLFRVAATEWITYSIYTGN